MANRRGVMRKSWYDVEGDAVISGASPGAIATVNLVPESTVEGELEGDATVLRVVGQIYLLPTAGSPIVRLMAYGGPPTGIGSSGPIALDFLEDPRLMWTYFWAETLVAGSFTDPLIRVDIRSKRRLRRNCELALYIEDRRATAGHDFTARWHLRTLMGF